MIMRLVALLAATIILDLVLIQPNHPDAATWGALRLFPLELPVIILALVALPHRAAITYALRALLVFAMVVLAAIKAADLAMFEIFNRAFNPLVDLGLAEAGIRLLAGSSGVVPATLVAILAGLAPFILAALLWWATGRWAAVRLPMPMPIVAGLAALLATGFAVAEIGLARRAWALPFDPPGAAFTARVALERTVTYRRLWAELEAFRAEAANDPYGDATNLFDRLDGADIVLVYVESYGRASMDNPRYAPTHMPTLEQAAADLSDAGLAMRSGWLRSPISGGQSWLAHGTLASGLRIDNQGRYAALLASPRRTLFHLAAASGYEPIAVMPAITLPWPEAERLGFSRVYAAADLGYEGEPFYWVTMPDQYTLSAFDRLVVEDDLPQLIQLALISSHAPWTPVPDLIDWADVGDGTEFNEMARSGDPPSVVWANRDRIRDQYRLSIDYSLRTAFDYVRLSSDRDRLVIILGDHPPVLSISEVENTDVPIHIIGPPDLVALIDSWNWQTGLIPAGDTPVWPMEAFRDRLIGALSSTSALEPRQ
jgi:hypothetical protein